MNKQIKTTKKQIKISLICFGLCFLSGILMILISNQNKIIDPLEFIFFWASLGFGLIGLGVLFSLIRYWFVEEDEQTDKKIEEDLKYTHKKLRKILKEKYKVQEENEQTNKNNK